MFVEGLRGAVELEFQVRVDVRGHAAAPDDGRAKRRGDAHDCPIAADTGRTEREAARLQRQELMHPAHPPGQDGVRRQFAVLSSFLVDRMPRQHASRLLLEKGQDARGVLGAVVVRVEGSRRQRSPRGSAVARVGAFDGRREPFAAQGDRDAMLRRRSHADLDAVRGRQVEAVDRLGQLLGPLADAAGPTIGDEATIVESGEVAPDGDRARLQLQAGAQGLDRPPGHHPGRLGEQRQVSRCRVGNHARCYRVGQAAYAFQCQPVERGCLRGLERRPRPERA